MEIENNDNKNVFIISAKESYDFLNENLNNILRDYNLGKSNIILPYNFEQRDYINMTIDYNSHNFLIQSDEYIKNLTTFNILNNSEIQDLRLLESKKRAYKAWLNEKLQYSRKTIPFSDTCLVIHKENLNRDIQKELRDEINIAKQFQKIIINIKHNKQTLSDNKVYSLKQRNKKDIF